MHTFIKHKSEDAAEVNLMKLHEQCIVFNVTVNKIVLYLNILTMAMLTCQCLAAFDVYHLS